MGLFMRLGDTCISGHCCLPSANGVCTHAKNTKTSISCNFNGKRMRLKRDAKRVVKIVRDIFMRKLERMVPEARWIYRIFHRRWLLRCVVVYVVNVCIVGIGAYLLSELLVVANVEIVTCAIHCLIWLQIWLDRVHSYCLLLT